jgi:hypothetical protein
MRLLVKYPTKWRWSQFKRNFQQYVALCHNLDKTSFLVTVDEDDPWPEDLSRDFGSRSHPYRVGLTVTPARGKVAAINHEIPSDGWDALVVVADDMIPAMPGWDEEIRQDFKDNPHAWIINYNDDPRLGENWRDLVTLPIMTRECYQHFGYVYNPIYESECCDCEQTTVVGRMGRIVHVDKRPIAHEWTKYQTDELTRINTDAGRRDNVIYEQRKAHGFT